MGYAAKAKQVLAERREGPIPSPTRREESEVSEERVADVLTPTLGVAVGASPSRAESEESGQSPEAGAAGDDGCASVEVLVARVLALAREARAAWSREVIHAAVWAAAGKRDDPLLLADLRALRRVEAAGSCLRCGALCTADDQFWCCGCRERYANATGGETR